MREVLDEKTDFIGKAGGVFLLKAVIYQLCTRIIRSVKCPLSLVGTPVSLHSDRQHVFNAELPHSVNLAKGPEGGQNHAEWR